MIEIQKNYKLTLTETQAKELYEFLRGAKDVGHLSVDRDLILVYNELKKIFDTLELEPTLKGQDAFFVNLEDLEQYEEVDKTVTQQIYEYFDYDIDKAIEEQKKNFPNPDKLSYEDWREDKYPGWSKEYNFDKVGYLMYLKSGETKNDKL